VGNFNKNKRTYLLTRRVNGYYYKKIKTE